MCLVSSTGEAHAIVIRQFSRHAIETIMCKLQLVYNFWLFYLTLRAVGNEINNNIPFTVALVQINLINLINSPRCCEFIGRFPDITGICFIGIEGIHWKEITFITNYQQMTVFMV